MYYLNALLLWMHLASIAVAGATVFGLPIVRVGLTGMPAGERPRGAAIAARFMTMSRAALVVLLVTGPLLVWLKYGDASGFNSWFWVKMVLVVVLLGVVIFAGINAKRAANGDASAIQRIPMIGMASMGVFLLILASAVLTFG